MLLSIKTSSSSSLEIGDQELSLLQPWITSLGQDFSREKGTEPLAC